MMASCRKRTCAALAGLALIALATPFPADCQEKPLAAPPPAPHSVASKAAPDAAARRATSARPDSGAVAHTHPSAQPQAAASPAHKKTFRQRVRAALKKINPRRLLRQHEYKKAAAKFGTFCKEWEQKLHEREVLNLGKIDWKLRDGYNTGTYTGYGPIETCTTKETPDGFALGELTYEEFTYYLAGRSQRDALHAKPKPQSDTHTTEIFRWDRGKWF
jgi:hypothetical protein